MDPKTNDVEHGSGGAKRRRIYLYDPVMQGLKNLRRISQSQRPLDKLIRNATLRTKTAWGKGVYGDFKGVTTSPIRTTSSKWQPCTYQEVNGHQSRTGGVLNGYTIRLVKTTWSTLVAIWGLEGIVCVPVQFVQAGHLPGEIDPGKPPTCGQCDEMTYTHLICPHCGAPVV